MTEILTKGGSLQGERREGILWSKDDVFAQMMGAKCYGHVRGVDFGSTPSRRSRSNLLCYTLTPLPSNETTHQMIELETLHQTLRDQLAQSEQRHQDQLAEALAEAKLQLDAQHKE